MFFKDPRLLCLPDSIRLRNRSAGESSFRLSKAYALGDTVEFSLTVPGNLGVYAPVLHIWRDGAGEEQSFPFEMTGSGSGEDAYALSFSLPWVTDTAGLLFFFIAFEAGTETLTFSSVNNVEGILTAYEDAKPFRMLIYGKDFKTPEWYKDAVMYHIFVDRFCRGSVPVPVKDTAVLNEDWDGGIPQYGEKPGDFCANNMFFGGTLYGIAEKLDYLSSLGVNLLYLSPIFDAYSNHKYDTGDYEKVDDMFGGDQGLRTLLCACRERGIRVILDGVFNHTGDDSRYFNRYGRYKEVGAYQSEASPYHDWYCFRHFPEEYECWWGIKILPKLNCRNPQVEDYLAGEEGIAAACLQKGVSGFRLDVADELPDGFLNRLRETVKKNNPEAVLLGEVWENAADKVAYGQRRSYFCGKQLDGVMNYPIQDAIVAFINKAEAETLKNAVLDIYSSYPSFVSQSLMNLLGTHDTERILTVLGTDRHKGLSNRELACFRMTDGEYAAGKKKLKCASVLQYTLPGVPSLFYGDEAGVQGGRDPFCRATFPWGHEDSELTEHYKALGRLRHTCPALRRGEIAVLYARNGVFMFRRDTAEQRVLVAVNSGNEPFEWSLEESASDLWQTAIYAKGQKMSVPPVTFLVLELRKSHEE